MGGAERPAQVGLLVPHGEEDRQLLEGRHARRVAAFRHEVGQTAERSVRFDAVDQVGHTRPMSGTNLKPWPEQAEPTMIGPRRSTRNRSSGVVVQAGAGHGLGRTPGIHLHVAHEAVDVVRVGAVAPAVRVDDVTLVVAADLEADAR